MTSRQAALANMYLDGDKYSILVISHIEPRSPNVTHLPLTGPGDRLEKFTLFLKLPL